MADIFTRLARRTLGLMPVVQPRIVSRFAREEAMASENANIEIPRVLAGDRGSSGLMPVVQPRIVSRFAREEAMASENANTEIPRVLAGDRGSSLSPVQPAAAQLSPSDADLQEDQEKQEGTPEGLRIDEERRSAEDRGREVQGGLRSGNQESERIAEVIRVERGSEIRERSEEKKGSSREREAESITRTILVEIEKEDPEKQEGTPEGLRIDEERRSAEDRGREVQGGLRSGNQESERIAEVIRVERGSEIRERSEEKKGSSRERGTIAGPREGEGVKKRTAAEKERRESLGAIASVEGGEKSPSKVLTEEIYSRREERWDGEERAIGEKAVEWENRGRESRKSESPDREEKQIASVAESLTERSRSKRREENALLRESGSPEGTVQRTVTADIFSRNASKSRESVKRMALSDKMRPGKVDLALSDGVDRSRESQSLGQTYVPESGLMEEMSSRREEVFLREEEQRTIGPREVKSVELSSPEKNSAKSRVPLDSQASAEVFSKDNSSLARAIASGSREEDKHGVRGTQAGLARGETQRIIIAAGEGEKQRVPKGPENRVELSSRREEELSRSEPERAIGPREKGTEAELASSRREKIQPSQTEKGSEINYYTRLESNQAPEIALRARYANGGSLFSIPAGEESIAEGQWKEKKRENVVGGEIITEREGRRGEIERNATGKIGNSQLLGSRRGEELKASVASTPTIQVTIGKIEVRGTKPGIKPVQQSPRRVQSRSLSPRLSLDEYLKQRNGGKI